VRGGTTTVNAYIVVTNRVTDNPDPYVEGWWTKIDERVGVRFTTSLWRSDRTGSAAQVDVEVAKGRLASGLMGAAGPFDKALGREAYDRNVQFFKDAEFNTWCAEARRLMDKRST
jgi:hypothetical protein